MLFFCSDVDRRRSSEDHSDEDEPARKRARDDEEHPVDLDLNDNILENEQSQTAKESEDNHDEKYDKILNLADHTQDYETDIFIMKKGGVTLGELNHSYNFPMSYRSHVSKIVKNECKSFLSQPLLQTGLLPPVAGSGDDGTYKHHSRHFIGLITVNPDGDNFLESIATGQPIMAKGKSGYELAKSIKSSFDEYGISGKLLVFFI